MSVIKPKTNTIFRGDNLAITQALPDACIDLIYIDPPFYSGRDYFDNHWGDQESAKAGPNVQFSDKRDFFEKHIKSNAKGLNAYVEWLRLRLETLHRILKPTGSLYLHLDWHASHYAKVVLDDIFGYKNFRSEIIWKRSNSKGNAFKSFANNTDTILYYVKNNTEYTWNPQFQSHDPEYVKKFYRFNDNDGRGPYRVGDLSSPAYRPNLIYKYKGYSPPKNGWRITKENMAKLDQEGRLLFPKSDNGRISIKRYLNEMKGTPVDNVWDDISPLQAQSKEKLGYPTQKPVALLERIILASSNKGDVVLDSFAGCGTAMHAAHNLKRKWISPTAIRVNKKRLEELGANVEIVDEKELKQKYGIDARLKAA
jgi:site-specific DNA-methyltransferase (adenine-specific)